MKRLFLIGQSFIAYDIHRNRLSQQNAVKSDEIWRWDSSKGIA